MSIKCPKCGYVRMPGNPAPEGECPQCGVIYARVAGKLKPEEIITRKPQVKENPQTEQCTSPDVLRELNLLIKSHYGLIWFKTADDDRAHTLLSHLADSLGLSFFTWKLTQGLKRTDIDGAVYMTAEPKSALDHVISSKYPAIYLFQGLGHFLNDVGVAARLEEVAREFSSLNGAMIITGEDINIPEGIRALLAEVAMPIPQRKEYEELLKNIIRDINAKIKVKIEISTPDLNRLMNNLSGLTLLEAEKILTRSIIEDGSLNAKDIQRVIDAKRAVVEKDGLLEYYPQESGMSEIADMATLKAWLGKRKMIINEPERAVSFGLTFPKGILLLGVPGSGKSLCAKAVSMEWGLPLLKMDPSNLYNKYIGESERNFKRAMTTAEKMSPVILWIDEIEKAFASGGSEDGGVSQRILGTFLSWMQDRKGDVFVVATANDVEKLPPEFLRKGRFDEIFFVDLPDDESRAAIFSIHIRKRGKDPETFNIQDLAALSEGFSGAEIEQTVVSALYGAFSQNCELSDELLKTEILKTRPLSVIRAEHIEKLRQWALSRTVNAH
jgi:AAA+ superfamily predicted ATPase